MVEVIMQPLLSVVQANVGLCFGQGAPSDTADSVGESSHGIGRLVGVAEAVRRLDFVVRVGGANSVNYGSPYQFARYSILSAVGKLRSQCGHAAGFVEVRQRIQTDGSLRCAVSSSSTSHWMAGKNMAYSSGSQ